MATRSTCEPGESITGQDRTASVQSTFRPPCPNRDRALESATSRLSRFSRSTVSILTLRVPQEPSRPMPDLEEQLQILRRGVEQIVPEDEFRKKLERSRPRGPPLARQVRHRPDRDRRPPRPHGPAAQAAAVPGPGPHGRHHHRQLHRARGRPLRPRRDPGHADRGAGRRPTPATTSRRSAGSSTWTGPRSTTTATGSRSGRSSTSST